jgi:hypothetical protein
MTTDLQNPLSSIPASLGEAANSPATLPATHPSPGTHLRTDTFCQGCGHNLIGQPVGRDERLGLLICQCPRCQRFHPAGAQSALSSSWNRLALVLLIVWIGFCLVLMSLFGIGMIATHISYLDDFTKTRHESPAGMEVMPNYNAAFGNYLAIASTSQRYDGPVITRKVVLTEQELQSNWGNPLYYQSWHRYMPYAFASASLYIAAGLFMAIAFWHWRRRGKWALLVPVFIGIASYTIWITIERGTDWVFGWTMRNLGAWVAFDTVALAVGLMIGRPLARLLVRLVVVPKRRPLFGFLWIADGKQPPGPPPQSSP